MRQFNALKCNLCTGDLIMDDSREFAVCEFCGTKYMSSTLHAKIQEIKGTVKVDGAVETTTGDAEKERLIKNAETYAKLFEFKNAIETYTNILESFPDDYRGWFGLFKTTLLSALYDLKNNLRPGINPLDFNYKNRKNLKKWFGYSLSLCQDKELLFSFFDDFIKTYGDKINTCELVQPLRFVYNKDLDHIPKIQTIDELTAWLIFFEDDYALLLNYEKLNLFIEKLKTQYINLLHKHLICPYVFKDEPEKILNYQGFDDEFFDFRISSKLQEIDYLGFQGYSVKQTYWGITIKRGKKAMTISPYVYISGWIFVSGGSGSESYFLIEQPKELTKYDIYQCMGICQHCGGEFKGRFSKVCSKCGRAKDY